jgi:hypothetical protein
VVYPVRRAAVNAIPTQTLTKGPRKFLENLFLQSDADVYLRCEKVFNPPSGALVALAGLLSIKNKEP